MGYDLGQKYWIGACTKICGDNKEYEKRNEIFLVDLLHLFHNLFHFGMYIICKVQCYRYSVKHEYLLLLRCRVIRIHLLATIIQIRFCPCPLIACLMAWSTWGVSGITLISAICLIFWIHLKKDKWIKFY